MKSCKTKGKKSKETITKEGFVKEKFVAGEYALDAIKDYLEQQASQGYKLVKVEGNYFLFEKTEPCNIKYSVEVFNKASNYDTIPAKTTEEFIEFCREAGWEYVCSRGKIQIFSTTDENVVPIETDPKAKLKTIKKSFFIPQILTLLVIPLITIITPILFAFSPTFSLTDIFIDSFASYSGLMIIIAILIIFSSIKFGIFYRENIKRVNNGLNLVFFTKEKEDLFNKILYVISAACIGSFMLKSLYEDAGILIAIFSVVIILIVIFISNYFYKKSKLTRTGNKIVVVIISIVSSFIIFIGVIVIVVGASILGIPLSKNEQKITYYDKEEKTNVTTTLHCEETPITLDDIGMQEKSMKYLESYCDKKSSIFGQKYECEQWQYNKNMEEIGNSFDYNILNTKFDFIKKSYIKMLKNDDEYEVIEESKEEAANWKAKKFYKLMTIEGEEDYDFIVEYEDQVLYFTDVFDGYDNYVKKNIDVIYDKLVANKEKY